MLKLAPPSRPSFQAEATSTSNIMAILTHTNCEDTTCSLCFREHLALEAELKLVTGDKRSDHLGQFHAFLSNKGINPETVYGWGTPEFFDDGNIAEYAAHLNSPAQ